MSLCKIHIYRNRGVKMENNTELNAIVHDFVETVSEAMKPVLEIIKNIFDSLSTAFLEAWKETKFSMNFFNKNITRKKFIKLLMSIGYQRNEASKIVWKYYEEKGKYTILDFMIESRKKEDSKNDLVRN